MAKITQTPLMKQYEEMKRKHPDAVLLFRVGDFYETFSEDAVVASDILGITLTRRANGANNYVELAGLFSTVNRLHSAKLEQAPLCARWHDWSLTTLSTLTCLSWFAPESASQSASR